MRQRGSANSFAPVVPARPRALLLGSYPSPLSFEENFYYGNPRNRFWPLAAQLAGVPIPQTVRERRALILNSRLALWDVIKTCTIIGAADSSITDPTPNDVPDLMQRYDIQTVFCNGAAAHRLYGQFCRPQTGIKAVRLPSTSPANAAFNMQKLLAAWQALAPYLRGDS